MSIQNTREEVELQSLPNASSSANIPAVPPVQLPIEHPEKTTMDVTNQTRLTMNYRGYTGVFCVLSAMVALSVGLTIGVFTAKKFYQQEPLSCPQVPRVPDCICSCPAPSIQLPTIYPCVCPEIPICPFPLLPNITTPKPLGLPAKG